MPGFIPLSTFKSFYSSTADLLTREGFEAFRQKLQGDEVREFVSREGISAEDFTAFLKSIQDQSAILFYEWVETDPVILGAIGGAVTDKPFTDPKGITKHRFFSDFRVFISPYLTESMFRSIPVSVHDKLTAMSYLVLLDEDHRMIVEQQYFTELRELLRALDKEAPSFTEEQQLVERVKPLCSDDIIGMVNSLSKASYALKLQFVDTLLSTVKTKACTVRFANWILKEMERVKLNREHEYKIQDIRNDLREGRISVRNMGKKGNLIRVRDAVTAAIIVILGSGIFYLVYYRPFSEPDGSGTDTHATFRKFTKEERMHIDSLIVQMKTEVSPDQIEIDPGYDSYDYGPIITIRKASANELMEQIYEDLTRDARIQQSQSDTCKSGEKAFSRYPGVKDLKARGGRVSSVFRNNSDYDAIVYVAEDKVGGEVFSMLVKKGEEKVVKLETGDLITLVYGNRYTKYDPPSNTGGNPRPSHKLEHHFCDTDVNYEESINVTYRYEDKARSDARFMISGSNGYYVRFIDVYDVLEEYGS